MTTRSNYTILGGVDEGFDIVSTLFKAGGELVTKGGEYKEAKDKEAKATKDSADDLKKSLDADALATSAGANALKDGASDADKLAYTLAATQQDINARGLSTDNQKKRAAAALDAVNKANAAWQKNSKDKAAENLVKAAQQTYAKTQNAVLVQQAGPVVAPKSSGSFFTKPVGVVVLVGGGLTLAGLIVLLVKMLKR